jgi:hypothetical protein
MMGVCMTGSCKKWVRVTVTETAAARRSRVQPGGGAHDCHEFRSFLWN